MATVRSRKRTSAAGERLINRELSFLDYDSRLLELARDESLPLLERVFFLKVSAEMLDEFFMVRVAGRPAVRQAPAHPGFGLAGQAELWRDELRPALGEERI